MTNTAKFHINGNGEAGPCRSTTEDGCPFGSIDQHYDSKESAREAYETKQAENGSNLPAAKKRLVESNGVMVIKGEVGTGDFIKSFSIPGTGESYYKGSWEELQKLVKDNIHDYEPGIGSVDGDVILVNVPPENFVSSIAEVTDENRHLVVEEDYVRAEGEKPVKRKVIYGKMTPAKFAQVVVYRADALARDDGRSTDAEWELVAVLGKIDEVEPMHPETMKRNNLHEEGGTYREYTHEEWEAAHDYWANHVSIVEKPE